MMKILLIFILSLMSGPVGCVVTGYAGGSVIVISERFWSFNYSRYICKMNGTICTDIIRSKSSEVSVEVRRFRIYKNAEGFFTVLIRRLKPEDAGTYRIRAGGWKSSEINLKVVNDSCCAEPQNVSAFPGQSISILSKYPEEYEEHHKFIVKLDNRSVIKVISNIYTLWLRFSVSQSARVVGVNISNVTEDDDGVYLLGVTVKSNSYLYFSYFSEFQLHVNAAKTESPPDLENSNSSRTMTISVSVCLALVLMGGIAFLIYKLRRKRKDASTPSSKDNEQVLPAACDYEEINQSKHACASNTNPYTTASSPSNGADTKITTIQPPPPDQNLTYTTLTFPNNSADAAVTFNKDSMTEYATVRHNTNPE